MPRLIVSTVAFVGLLIAGARAADAKSDPLAKEKASLQAMGYSVERTLTGSVGKTKLAALLFKDDGGSGLHRLRAYTLRDGKASLIYLEVSPTVRITLDDVHSTDTFPKLFGDDKPFFIYAKELPGLNQRVLVVMRYDGRAGKWKPVSGSPFPDGALQDIAGDGTLELVTRSLPLGNFFTIECRDFQTMTRTAFRTRILRWSDGRFEAASKGFRSFYEDDLRRLKAALDANDPRKTNDYGMALGLGLSIYYDFAEIGEAREGWRRFSEVFTPKGHLPPISTCIRKIRTDLRGSLGIPDDWPD